MNCTRKCDSLFLPHEAWDVCNDLNPLAATHRSGLQLDYICAYPKGAFEVKDFMIGPLTTASDHMPVTTTLEQK